MPGTEQWRTLLSLGEMEVIGRMPNSSNATLLVRVTHDDAETRAIYKPGKGERPLWDFPPGLYRREVAAYELSRALGWDQVPCTVLRDGPHDEGSVQLFVEFDPQQHYFTIHEEREDLHDELRRMAVFDIIANNTDRKGGHCLEELGSTRVYGIDHGLTFHAHPKLRTVIWDFGGEEIPDGLLRDVARACADLAADGPLAEALGPLIAPHEVWALLDRAQQVLEIGRAHV